MRLAREAPWYMMRLAGQAQHRRSRLNSNVRRHKVTSMPATKSELAAFLAAEFPQSKCTLEAAGNLGATVRHEIGFSELRPGGTVSGPVLMTVADVALYAAILAEVGIKPLAVTTSLTINFMRKPSASAAIIGVCKLMKLGRSLAVGEVNLYSEGSAVPVAHAVGTYSIPPDPTETSPRSGA